VLLEWYYEVGVDMERLMSIFASEFVIVILKMNFATITALNDKFAFCKFLKSCVLLISSKRMSSGVYGKGSFLFRGNTIISFLAHGVSKQSHEQGL
jgi:hypothetical protein